MKKFEEDIKIGFFIENSDIPEAFKEFKLYIQGKAWKFSISLNFYLLEYPMPQVRKMLEIIYQSKDAPKAFGIVKMCLDYLLSECDNEIEYTKERLKIKACYKAVEKYEAYYHLFTEGS